MNELKRKARIAGLLYLLMGVTGGFGIMYVPVSIMVDGDTAATAHNLANSGWLFRLSMISNLISQTSFIFLVLALNRIFKEVDTKQARLMITLVTAAVPIAFINTLSLAAAQIAISADYLTAFSTDQRNGLMMGLLKLYEVGIIVVEIFWGLWLLPFGILVFKSGFIPKVLGVFLIIGCFAYLIDSFTGLLLPHYRKIIANLLMIPLSIGEFSIIIWLLVWGVKETKIPDTKPMNN